MTRDDVIAGLKRQPVPFEAGGLALWLRPWTAEQRSAFIVWRRENKGLDKLDAKLFVLSVCDAAGSLLFADTPEDVAAVNRDLDGAALDAVGTRVMVLNGFGAGPGN